MISGGTPAVALSGASDSPVIWRALPAKRLRPVRASGTRPPTEARNQSATSVGASTPSRKAASRRRISSTRSKPLSSTPLSNGATTSTTSSSTRVKPAALARPFGPGADILIGHIEAGDTDDFVDAGDPRAGLQQPVLAQRTEPRGARDPGGFMRRQALQDRLAQRRDQLDHLIDRDAPLVAGAVAVATAGVRSPARHLPQFRRRGGGELVGDTAGRRRRGRGASRAQLAAQALRQDTAQPAADHER